MSQNCYAAIQKDSEEDGEGMEARWIRRRKSSKKQQQKDDMKLSAETRMILAGLFVVLNFIYTNNFKFVDDYRSVSGSGSCSGSCR